MNLTICNTRNFTNIMLNERSPPLKSTRACSICMKVKKAKPTYTVRSQHSSYLWHILKGSKHKEAQYVWHGKVDVLLPNLDAVLQLGSFSENFLGCTLMICKIKSLPKMITRGHSSKDRLKQNLHQLDGSNEEKTYP